MAFRLPLASLEIEGYRAIRHLRIDRLAQANLFVGKNNVGKTSLLEAIRLYASRNAPTVITQLFAERAENHGGFSFAGRRLTESVAETFEAIATDAEAFFYGSFTGKPIDVVRIGPAGLDRDVLEITLPWAEAVSSTLDDRKLRTDWFATAESPVIQIRRGEEEVSIAFDTMTRRVPLSPRRSSRGTVLMIPATGWRNDQIARLWDAAATFGMASEVDSALRTILPDLERVYLIGDTGSRSRSIRFEMAGASRPVPLRAMGDGVNRVFGIAVALVQARGGVLLIDEFENGLHYTVQEEVWRAILKLAEHLEVQVFATTHSWDGIQAFAAASSANEQVEGMLHRLEQRRGDTLRVVDLTEDDLALVTRQHVEVR